MHRICIGPENGSLRDRIKALYDLQSASGRQLHGLLLQALKEISLDTSDIDLLKRSCFILPILIAHLHSSPSPGSQKQKARTGKTDHSPISCSGFLYQFGFWDLSLFARFTSSHTAPAGQDHESAACLLLSIRNRRCRNSLRYGPDWRSPVWQ